MKQVRLFGVALGLGALAIGCGGRSISKAPRDNEGSTGSGGSSSQQLPPLQNGAAPRKDMLNDGCASICQKAADAHCREIQLDDCTSSCSKAGDIAFQTASCATTLYEFLRCVLALPDVCTISGSDKHYCNDGTKAVLDCTTAYCDENPDAAVCQNLP